MKRGFKLRNYKIAKLKNRSRGYILISLMLFLALLTIAALAVLPSVAFQIQRDREEELIHRGLGYSRGIRRFYKKFGRYPTRIEELENTNNLRFIRKRYKDPMTGADFKILRMGDVQLINVPGLAGAPAGVVPGQGGALGAGAAGLTQAMTQQAGTAQQVQQVTTTDTTNASGGGSDNSASPQAGSNPSGASSSSSSSSTSGLGGQVFGGGPMLGVASASKKKTVREFCNKNHYNDWKFIYDPSTDLGAPLNSPWCPGMGGQGIALNPSQTGAGQAQPNTGLQGGTPPPVPSNPGSQMPPEQ